MTSENTSRISSFVAIAAFAVAVGAWVALCHAVMTIGPFHVMYEDFDAKLPPITETLLNLPRPIPWAIVCAAAVVGLAAQFGLSDPNHKILAQLTLGLGLVVMVILLYAALYSPLFTVTQRLTP